MPLAARGTAVLAAQNDQVELPRFLNGTYQVVLVNLTDATFGLQLGDMIQIDELIERTPNEAEPSLLDRYQTPPAPPARDALALLPRTHDLGYVVRIRLLTPLAGGRQLRVGYVAQKLA